MQSNNDDILGTDDFVEDDTYVPAPNTEQLEGVRKLASVGLRPSAIAEVFQVTTEHLLKSCGDEITNAELDSHQGVLEALYMMAISQGNLSASLVWIKTHCPELLPAPESKDDSPKSSSKSDKKKPYVWDPNDPNDRVRFSVYNNDGEPNADY